MQRFGLDPTGLQHKVVHKDDGAEGAKMSSPKNRPTLSVAADIARKR